MVVESNDCLRYVSIARMLDLLPVAEYRVPHDARIPSVMFEDRVDRIMRSGRVRESSRLTVLDKDVGSIHFETEGQYVFIVFAHKEYPQRTAFKFLGEVRKEFLSRYEQKGVTTNPLELSDACEPFLKQLCSEFNVLQKVDKVVETQALVDDVKGQMQENLQSAVSRGEKLDDLMVQAEALRSEAGTFRQNADSAKNKFWYQNLKLTIAIAVLIIILILVIVLPLVLRR